MDSLITIVAPLHDSDVAHVGSLIDALGNPASDPVREALQATDEDGGSTHFMSLHAIPAGSDEEAHLVMEFTGDGSEARAMERIHAAIGPELERIFANARDWRGNVGLLRYLQVHRIGVGSGLFDNPGLCFAGTPGLNVRRIRREAALARFVAPLIDDGGAGLRPLERLAKVRDAVAASDDHRWALDPPLPPDRDEAPSLPIGALAGAFVASFLWPLGVVLALVFVVALIVQRDLGDAIGTTFSALGILVVLTLVGAAAAYFALRAQEQSDWLDERTPDLATLSEIRQRENHCAQNHMVSITTRKPGLIRWLTIRLVFWLIGQLATRVYRPGFLGGISTIHAARWITIPGTRKLIFFSNYGGSWESYLEDFITRAHAGLTAVWSNSIGFPRAKNLFQDGATDGERFKRYARASMAPTRFWYSAYPMLTTAHVRANAEMRRGLAAALTNDEAALWLSLFGSAPRPDAKLETMEIQSLVFGGLGFMKDGVCLLYNLPDNQARAGAFIAGLFPDVGFGDGRKLRRPAVVTVALGATALDKLGLPQECVKGFAAAFLEGMHIEGRNRILGDTGVNGPEHWLWGREPHDVALLVYGENAEEADALAARIGALAEANGMAAPHRIPLVQTKKPAIEPFGFVDGISQPIIRGSYQSFRKTDPIHLVQPGEFVIGYPDDRNNFPPEPELSALLDPHNVLPVAERSREFGNSIVDAPRSIGRNGTYLVIRQLEQDVAEFDAYCREEAERISDRLPAPYAVDRDFIAAKLVGRWPDGSSLVRNPYYPYPTEQAKREERHDNRPTAMEFKAPGEGAAEADAALAATGQPLGAETVRPETRPAEGTAIPTPPDAQAGNHALGTAQRFFGDNDFLYGTEDPQATRCPYGAHIRRANPRDSLMPGSMEQVSISNRHRIYRLGRLYAPGPDGKQGLLFMCLNGDIERQFEFVQQTWLISPAFHGLVGEQDPLNSDGGETNATCYTIPTNDGPVRLKALPRFVRTLGGGYFFMPSRALLRYLGGL
jgi:deferrochelatase/peroxidase EfeB